MTDDPSKATGHGPAKAVALRYDAEAPDGAPEVVATGRGEVAERILEVAKEAGVPIHSDGDLLSLLAAVELGDEIPVEVYAVVAELISFLWALNEERRGM